MIFDIDFCDVLLMFSIHLLFVVLNYGIMLAHFQRRGDFKWDEEYNEHEWISFWFASPGIFILPALLIYTDLLSTGIKFKREEKEVYAFKILNTKIVWRRNYWYYKYLTRDTKRESEKYCRGLWASIYKNH